MAEVKRLPKWLMLEALRNKVFGMRLEKSDETFTGFIQLLSQQFSIDPADSDPVLKMLSTKTLEVGAGDTIMAIVLVMDEAYGPPAYGPDDIEIRYPIGGVDGETFPDGGSIDVTEFAVNLDDL